jgi:hypothetical protein
METSGTNATLEDMVFWTMPTTEVVPGINDLAARLSEAVGKALSEQFLIKCEAREILLQKKLLAPRREALSESLRIALSSTDANLNVDFNVPGSAWSALVCEFFGSIPGPQRPGVMSPAESMLWRQFVECLRQNAGAVFRAYGLNDWAIIGDPAEIAGNQCLSVDFVLQTSTLPMLECRCDLSLSLLRRIWHRLQPDAREASHELITRNSVFLSLAAEMPFSGIPIKRILDHDQGEVMILGEASRQKVKLLCNDVVACEGLLTERNGKYAIEITKVG